MECSECDFKDLHPCSHCLKSVCEECSDECKQCGKIMCFECSENCDLCSSPICKDTCMFITDVCKCCKKQVRSCDKAILCINCITSDWFSPHKSEGFWCTLCTEHCEHADTCNVNSIISSQVSCPICFEDFDNRSFEWQQCELHKICKACGYNYDKGCPVCREGWRAL